MWWSLRILKDHNWQNCIFFNVSCELFIKDPQWSWLVLKVIQWCAWHLSPAAAAFGDHTLPSPEERSTCISISGLMRTNRQGWCGKPALWCLNSSLFTTFIVSAHVIIKIVWCGLGLWSLIFWHRMWHCSAKIAVSAKVWMAIKDFKI